MVVDRRLRRSRVCLEGERILLSNGPTAPSTLAFLVSRRLSYEVNYNQVTQFLRGHPRIVRSGTRQNRFYEINAE